MFVIISFFSNLYILPQVGSGLLDLGVDADFYLEVRIAFLHLGEGLVAEIFFAKIVSNATVTGKKPLKKPLGKTLTGYCEGSE